MNKIILSLLLLTVAFSQPLFSQQDVVSPSLPPSPEVAAIAKYGDVPVGEFTGSHNFSVPLYQLGFREISVPISISYNSIGAKVAEEASEVGLGWSFHAGGVISRTIRGRDDFGEAGGCAYDDYTNYYKSVVENTYGGINLQLGEPLANSCWQEYDDGNLHVEPYQEWCSNASWDVNADPCVHTPSDCITTSGLVNKDDLCTASKWTDLESDLYTFSVGGFTGKFVIDQLGGIRTLEQSEVIIELNYDSSNEDEGDVSWNIIAPNGLTYVFGSTIDSRQFTYSSTISETYPNGSSTITGYCPFITDRYISSWHLDAIVTPRGETVVFTYEREVEDVVPVPMYSENTSTITNAELLSVGCGGGPGDPYTPDQFTESATLIKYDDVRLASIETPYGTKATFDYSDRDDIYGGEKLDGVKIYQGTKLLKEWSLTYDYFSSYTQVGDNVWFHFGSFANFRGSASDNYLDFAGQFGGQYQFENDKLVKRLKLVSVQDLGDGTDQFPPFEFTYDEAQKMPPKHSKAVDFWGYPNLANSNNMLVPTVPSDATIAGADREVNPLVINIYGLSEVKYPTGGETHFEYELNSVPFFSDVITVIEEKLGGGYRVHSVCSYARPDEVSGCKYYNYNTDLPNALDITSGKAYNFPVHTSYVGEYAISNNGCATSWAWQRTRLNRSSSSYYGLSHSLFGSFVGYSKVTVSSDEEGQALGRVEKEFHNDLTYSVIAPEYVPRSWPKYHSPQNGNILSETIFKRGEEDFIQQSVYTYSKASYHDSHWNYVVHFPYPASPANEDGVPVTNLFSFLCEFEDQTFGIPHLYAYADNFKRVQLDQVVTTKRDIGGEVVQTMDYTYVPNSAFKRSETIGGPGGSKMTQYFYPFETSDLDADLVAANMLGVPVRVIASNGSTYRTEYNSTHFVPEKFTEVFSNGDVVIHSQVDDFWASGHPKEISTFQLPDPITYVWSNGLLNSKSYKEHSESWTYLDRKLESHTAIDGQVVNYTYDGLQRLEEVSARDGGIISTSVYSIGEDNEIITTTAFSDDLTNNTVSKQTFDGLGRPLNAYLNEELQEGRTYDSYGRIRSQTFMPDRWMTLIYEPSPLNRIRREVYPDVSSVRYQYIVEEGYSGVRITDEEGNQSKVLSDVFGRTYKSIDALGGETEYAYKSWDAPDWIQPPLGPRYEYNYDDDLRQLKSKEIPGGGTTSYFYDEVHRLSATHTAQGDIIGNIYDDYGRLFQTYHKGVLPTAGLSYIPSGDAELLTQNLYVDPTTPNDPDIGRLMQSSVKFLRDGLGMATTDFVYDAYGRLDEQTELFTLNGQTHSIVTSPHNYTHRDLSGVVQNSHYRNVTPQNPTNGTEHTLTSTSVFDNFGRAENVSQRLSSYPRGGSGNPLDARWTASFAYDKHGQMDHKRFFQNPLSGTWYEEDYSYNNRGWLTHINRPLSRDYDVDDCGIPQGNVYQGGSVEDEVTFEQLLDYIIEGSIIDIVSYNDCPSDPVDPPIDNPVQETCLEDVVDSYMNIDERSGLPIDHAVGFQPVFDDLDSNYYVTDVRLSSLTVTLATYNTGTGEEFIILPGQYDIYHHDYDADTVNTTLMESESNQLIADLQTWAEGEGISLPEIKITYNNSRIDINILEGGVEFIKLRVNQIWTGKRYDSNNPGSIVQVTEFDAQDFLFNHANFYQIDCKEGTKTSSSSGGSGSATYPLHIYHVKLENTTPETQFLTDDELNASTEKYEIENTYIITASDQQINLTLQSGSQLVVSVDGFFDAQADTSDPITQMNLPVNEKGEPIKIPTDEAPCPIYNLPTCTADEIELQAKEIAQIIEDIDPASLTYPVTLSYIMLCTGQRVLVIGTEQELENTLPGNFHYLDGELVSSPDQVFNIRRKVPDGLFNLELKYEKNGNIRQARWKTTYHHTRYYDYTYDALNRLKSASYGVETFPGLAAPTTGDGFTADNFTYDAIGNILTLRRYAQLTPGTEGVLIDDLKYAYGSLLPGQAATPNTTTDVSRLMAVDELGTTNDALQNGFMPGNAVNGDQYGYDPAGNLTTDAYKGISIVYNHLNLPEKIGNIDILYDASGRKWQMEYPNGTIRQYIAGMEFVDDEFQSMSLGDGRIYATETSPGSGTTEYVAEYWHKDHLGNTRVTFADRNGDGAVQLLDGSAGATEINQTLDYYPFGLQHPGAACRPDTDPENAYRYNGKELLEDVGLYDYGARYYDPAIGRWNAVDPLAESFPEWNPYVYVYNDPLAFTDPTGMAGDLTNGVTIYFRRDASVSEEEFAQYTMGYIQNVIDNFDAYGVDKITFASVSGDFSEGDLGKGENLVNVGNYGERPSHVTGGNNEIAFMNIASGSANTAAHEFGHHLGLSDRYLDGFEWSQSSGIGARKTTPIPQDEIPHDLNYEPWNNLYSNGSSTLTPYQQGIASSPAVEPDYQHNRGLLYGRGGDVNAPPIQYTVGNGSKKPSVRGLRPSFGRGSTLKGVKKHIRENKLF